MRTRLLWIGAALVVLANSAARGIMRVARAVRHNFMPGMRYVRANWPLTKNATWLLAGWLGLIIAPLLFDATRGFWWDKIFSLPGIVMTVLFTLYGYMMWSDPNKPFRWTLANWATGILVVVAVLYVFGATARDWYDTHDLMSLFQPSNTRVRYIFAPVGKPSDEYVEMAREGQIDPEGLIWVVDQDGKLHESGDDKLYAATPLRVAKFQSRTNKVVRVKITTNK